ncbi:hypothetical protein [Sphingosinicella sp. BN140058]|uniref:hypothetical protein n=1 Tax=Sphingosinicella sp. BN140058 TaxID=1892855 RepID=UPI00101387EE|nr:hypothetical protein [Sphingosinicella sp. BN140058]QAY78155.1 hypothetical protein ETR14_17695 [Sphingosinicella sp. BN140058]
MRIWLIFFSMGWLVPFALSIWAAFDFLWRVVWPLAAWHDGSNVTTFHLFEWSQELLFGSVVWLGAAILYWVLRATTRSPS